MHDIFVLRRMPVRIRTDECTTQRVCSFRGCHACYIRYNSSAKSASAHKRGALCVDDSIDYVKANNGK